MKNVALAGHFFWPSIGGIEIFLEQLGINLVNSGYCVDIITKKNPSRKKLSPKLSDFSA